MSDNTISTKTEDMSFYNKTRTNFGSKHKNETVKIEDENKDTVPLPDLVDEDENEDTVHLPDLEDEDTVPLPELKNEVNVPLSKSEVKDRISLSEMGLGHCAEECYRIKSQIYPKNTYLLNDEEQLNDLIDKYNQNKVRLSDKDIKYYQKFIDKYNETAETAPFEKNIDAKKAFLALKKLDKYDYDTNAIPIVRKRINENSETLGQYSNDYNELKSIINSDLEYKNAMEEFYNQLYKAEAYTCFLSDDKNLVHKEAKKVLDNELSKYTNDNDKLDNLYITSDFRSATFINDVDNDWNNWCVYICITGNLDKKKAYLPEELVILHELYHVKQITPGEKENYRDPFKELGAALDSVVKSDEIHKKINNIPLDETVEYSYVFTTKDGTKMNLGELVNKFRNIKQKHNCRNWEQVYMTQEGIELVKELFEK